MDILITGDRREFCPKSFERRLHDGLSKLNVPVSSIRNIVRTSFGGAELRAEEYASKIGKGVVKIPLPDNMGKHARKAALTDAVGYADAIIILDDENDAYCWHLKDKAGASGKPLVVC